MTVTTVDLTGSGGYVVRKKKKKKKKKKVLWLYNFTYTNKKHYNNKEKIKNDITLKSTNN
eukprot:NODE_26557_length_546_cov_5.262530.p1 GENE.NODE_26557_length_546_cov_5.262530~~NODE_26557_length_546_cov_5.262530.p1  ORF type:complete len:60 (+),score=15.31 NODE_26557_length_546_cov_5.262530:303-482(+)